MSASTRATEEAAIAKELLHKKEEEIRLLRIVHDNLLDKAQHSAIKLCGCVLDDRCPICLVSENIIAGTSVDTDSLVHLIEIKREHAANLKRGLIDNRSAVLDNDAKIGITRIERSLICCNQADIDSLSSFSKTEMHDRGDYGYIADIIWPIIANQHEVIDQKCESNYSVNMNHNVSMELPCWRIAFETAFAPFLGVRVCADSTSASALIRRCASAKHAMRIWPAEIIAEKSKLKMLGTITEIKKVLEILKSQHGITAYSPILLVDWKDEKLIPNINHVVFKALGSWLLVPTDEIAAKIMSLGIPSVYGCITYNGTRHIRGRLIAGEHQSSRNNLLIELCKRKQLLLRHDKFLRSITQQESDIDFLSSLLRPLRNTVTDLYDQDVKRTELFDMFTDLLEEKHEVDRTLNQLSEQLKNSSATFATLRDAFKALNDDSVEENRDSCIFNQVTAFKLKHDQTLLYQQTLESKIIMWQKKYHVLMEVDLPASRENYRSDQKQREIKHDEAVKMVHLRDHYFAAMQAKKNRVEELILEIKQLKERSDRNLCLNLAELISECELNIKEVNKMMKNIRMSLIKVVSEVAQDKIFKTINDSIRERAGKNISEELSTLSATLTDGILAASSEYFTTHIKTLFSENLLLKSTISHLPMIKDLRDSRVTFDGVSDSSLALFQRLMVSAFENVDEPLSAAMTIYEKTKSLLFKMEMDIDDLLFRYWSSVQMKRSLLNSNTDHTSVFEKGIALSNIADESADVSEVSQSEMQILSLQEKYSLVCTIP